MARKVLNIIDTPYRCTLEEQDEPAIWITHVIRGLGAEMAVLLRGNGVNYAARGQDAAGLRFGDRPQTQPPRLDDDVEKLAAKGVDVYVVEDDAAERGLERSDLVAGIKTVSRSGVAKLYGQFDQIWHW
jgi:intracellular sulfur oxidation DsrE/DsrF family protein